MDTLELFIKRLYSKPSHIIGQLSIEDNYFSDSLERPWLNNQENISCIPAGRYEVQMLFSEHFQRNLPHLLNVPNRTNVMIHPGNTVNDTEGCILVGKNSAPGILTNSRDISDKLNALLTAETRPVFITVTDVVS
jgi:hypothetical protein